MESNLRNFNLTENRVSTVILRGLSMISLCIDGKERVCLAQISNSLLKKYSYNEIHNRRVALGINCVQCTTAQLEILRNAGAMPASSRRCGMITKKEAERLVKSFLDESKPPKLPETFSFKVEHKCEFGCQGVFFPSRYNSSRAKCIRCSYCNLFFSPNKFIFHSHERPNFKYQPTGNVNFNSWRKHITLINEDDDEQLNSAWEDVKSIFNSGKRKRGHFYEDSDSESNIDYSFETVEKSDEKIDMNDNKQTINANEKIQGLLNNSLISLLNPMYQSNHLYLLPEFLQLNKNFLLQNQLNKTSSDFLMNCLINNRIETNISRNKNDTNSTALKSRNFFSIQEHLK